jgi:hypothetical protein
MHRIRAARVPPAACRGSGTEQGTVLLMILLSLFAIGLMSMVVAQVATTEIAITANLTASQQTFLPADGASQVLLHDLVSMSRALGRFPSDAELATIAAPPYNNVTLSQFTAFADGGVRQTTLADGLHVGLSAEIQPFRVLATTESDGPPPSATTVEIHGEFASIPIYQFGVLYEGDLDVHNGPPMTITGRVHSNGNVFLDPGMQTTFESTVTASGNIYNAHEAGYVSGGAVYIKDSQGADRAMAGLDSSSGSWTSASIERWDGRVRSGETGGDRIDLVIEDPNDPRLIIAPGRAADTAADQAAKIWYDAGLRIINGRGYDADGNLVSTVDPFTGTDALRCTTLYDWRQEQYMLTVEVDLDKLGRSPGYPANGVVYLGALQPDSDMPDWPGSASGVGPAEWSTYPAPWSSSTTEFAFKTRNSTQLAGPLTLVSDNPVYVHGNFNTFDKQPAAILADALTILSNNWGDTDNDGVFDSDLDYSLQSLSDRHAAATTVNAAIMTGNVDMGTSYNGGLENLPRLLERWGGVQLTLLGSLAALWESEHADGLFGKSGVYVAAVRNWNFDTDFLDLAKLPPETPRIYKITVTGWERH